MRKALIPNELIDSRKSSQVKVLAMLIRAAGLYSVKYSLVLHKDKSANIKYMALSFLSVKVAGNFSFSLHKQLKKF